MHPLSDTESINDMALTQNSQYLNQTWMKGCAGYLDITNDTWARSQWHDRMSCDSRRHPMTWDGFETCGHINWEPR